MPEIKAMKSKPTVNNFDFNFFLRTKDAGERPLKYLYISVKATSNYLCCHIKN